MAAHRWLDGARGQHFGVGDLLIAGLAYEIGGLVWSLDADFERMSRLKFVELYDPSRTNAGAHRRILRAGV